jgi:neopullulanase
MYKKISLAFLLFLFFTESSFAQIKVYPTNWWVGMKEPKLQLMVHQKNIGDASFSLEPYAGVKMIKAFVPENKNYVFIDLTIAPVTKPGKIRFKVRQGNDVSVLSYELKQRDPGNGKNRVKGVNSSDLIYLIMPDRFSNGDTSNDKISSLREEICDRKNPYSRHGGDLKGVQDHLDYLKNLGVTSIWLTPIVENDMPLMNEYGQMVSGYHGYWFTDHYTIDPRFGGNKAYHELIEAAHMKGLKIIQDAVYNHVGNHHWSILDMPMKDWVNQWPTYTNSNHKEEVFYDPYTDSMDKEIMIRGWFTPHLPDLNNTNPYCANYLVQNAVWTTEEFGIDGWRVDTYKYCNEAFMNRVNAELEREFPAITIFGEAWCGNVAGSAYFTRNNLDVPFKHNLQGVTDFPFSFAMRDATKQGGLNYLYTIASQDFLYKDPSHNCIFLDNHDMDRFYSVLGEDFAKYKIAIGLLMTERGIPELYYGTEILMKNMKSPSDAMVREDFPGGWYGDVVNKFDAIGRSVRENEAFNYIRTVADFRKTSPALTTGKTLQYQPADNIYVYFRYNNSQRVMCIVNSSENAREIKLDRYRDGMAGKTRAIDVITKKEISLGKSLMLEPNSISILDLK